MGLTDKRRRWTYKERSRQHACPTASEQIRTNKRSKRQRVCVFACLCLHCPAWRFPSLGFGLTFRASGLPTETHHCRHRHRRLWEIHAPTDQGLLLFYVRKRDSFGMQCLRANHPENRAQTRDMAICSFLKKVHLSFLIDDETMRDRTRPCHLSIATACLEEDLSRISHQEPRQHGTTAADTARYSPTIRATQYVERGVFVEANTPLFPLLL